MEGLRVKDRILLILASLLAAGLAWAFFHYLGQNAWSLFSAALIIALGCQNIRLQRKLKALRSDADSQSRDI
ncbi:hypothetical protein SAMN05216189_102578 [Pseudomonas delhiensis]|uniref:Uncharacterized protein n=1 Tax=Pseudomonas delhiensis TaxID=366289 RepID=A0A239LRI7_9PSED|nr:hypothetical protein SAMN05216189_102578 [Pseudomonas delhiensis]SNT33071.1 hypothetical protein SAMN06295949_121123 [Pseudomonas delhiensis]